MSPRQAILLGENMEAYGCEDFYICERGTSFGYDNLVVDFRTIHKLRECDSKFVLIQLIPPRKVENLQLVATGCMQPLAQSAKIWGAEAFFVEVHPDPSRALSDRHSRFL